MKDDKHQLNYVLATLSKVAQQSARVDTTRHVRMSVRRSLRSKGIGANSTFISIHRLLEVSIGEWT